MCRVHFSKPSPFCPPSCRKMANILSRSVAVRISHLISAGCHNNHWDGIFWYLSKMIWPSAKQRRRVWSESWPSSGLYCWSNISLATLKYCQLCVANWILHLPIKTKWIAQYFCENLNQLIQGFRWSFVTKQILTRSASLSHRSKCTDVCQISVATHLKASTLSDKDLFLDHHGSQWAT